MLYFRTHSYHADNCQAKENLQKEDEADIKAAQWIFKVRKKFRFSHTNVLWEGVKWCIWKRGERSIDVMNNSHRLFITKT